MSYKPGDSYYGEFTTQRFDTGAATDADSAPAATATHNGTDDGSFSLTVNRLNTGRYSIRGTIPGGYASGDVVQISAAATVNGVSGTGVVDSFVLDSKRVGDLQDASVSAIQNGLATGAEISTLQSHGDSAWTTATGFALASVWTSGLANTIATNLDTNVGSRSTFAGGPVASVTAAVTVGANNDKTGYALSATGLDAIATSEPSGAVDGWNFRQRLLALFGRFFNKATLPDNGNGTLTVYQRDGTTPLSAQTVSDDGTTQTQGGA